MSNVEAQMRVRIGKIFAFFRPKVRAMFANQGNHCTNTAGANRNIR